MNPATRALVAAAFMLAATQPASADVISFSSDDFTTTPAFNDVTNFSFVIDLDEVLVPGAEFSSPRLNSIDYSVQGSLPSGSPSGFPAFNLVRAIPGPEFYTQGSSLSFGIDAGADLSDGLQLSELSSPFVFNGREVGTGRYHPALLELNADGTGSLTNSNNTGGINPGSGSEVNVEIGDEYLTNLAFDPATTVSAVPLPGALLLLGSALGLGAAFRRRG